MYTDIYLDTNIDGQIDRQIDRQMTYIHMDRFIDTWMDRQKDRYKRELDIYLNIVQIIEPLILDDRQNPPLFSINLFVGPSITYGPYQ